MPRLRLDPFSPSGVSIVADSPRAKQQNGYVARTEKLSQISDVDALTPSNGQALAYNSTTKTWRPTTISGGTGGGTTLPADAAGWLHDDGIGTLAWTTPAKSDVGLSNVDNTSDANKPVSTATQTALNGKENSITIGTSAQYYRGDKTMQTLNQDAVPSGTTNKAYTATEQTKLAAITGTNTGDQTLSISGSNLTISGTNGNTVALPSTGGTTSDATTTAKGIIELAGDLSGTAASPTVTATHLAAALPVAQGGTGVTTSTGSGSTVLSTSPSLTTPKADIITDTNGGKEIELVATASSANWVKLTNTVAGSGVTVGVNGTGTNENLTLAAMGTGTVQVGGSQVTTAANTQTLTNKTLTAPVISTITNTGTLTLPTTTGTVALTSSNITGTAAGLSANIAESQVTNLTTDLAAKATDTAVVHLANAEAITGAKTFNSGSLVLKGATTGTTTLNATGNALGTVTVPATTDTLVALNTTDTLTNKTLTSPTINTPIITQSVSTQTTAATLAVGSSAIQYANATTAAFTVTLPTTTTAGISFTIVKTDSSANAVTVAGTINGVTNYILTSQWSYIQVVSTTTSGTWYIIDNSTANTAANVSGTVAVANGGTGANTLTGIIKGNGTGAMTTVAAPSGTIVGTTDSQTLSAKTFSDYVQVQGNSGAPATPGTGMSKLFAAGTSNVRPRYMNESGTLEIVQTSQTIGYLNSAQITANAAGSTTLSAVTGLSVTVTASGLSRHKITFFCRDAFQSGGGVMDISLWQGTVGTGTQLQTAEPNNPNGSAESINMIYVTPSTVSAGSVTYNIGIKGSTGTPNIEAGAAYPAQLIVEAI